MRNITEKFFVTAIYILFASIAFYFLLPVRGSLPGLTTFTLTKTAAFLVIITGLIHYNISLKDSKPELWQIVLIVFALLGVVSALLSEMRIQNLKYAFAPLTGIAAMLLSLRMLNESPKAAAVSGKILLAAGIISVTAGYLEFFGGAYFDGFFRIFRSGVLHWDFNGILRISGIFCDTNYFSNFLLFFNFFLLALLMSAGTRTKAALFFLLSAFAFQALILTYSRSNTVAFMASACFFSAVYFFTKKADRKTVNRLMAAVAVMILIYAVNLSFNPALKNRVSNLNTQITGNQRVELQKAALKLSKTRILFGTGFADYGKKIHNDPAYMFPGINDGVSASIISPHSFYLGILLATGVAGLLTFMLFCALYLYRLFVSFIKGNTMSLAALGWIAGFLMSGILGKEMYVIEDAIFFFMITGLGAFYAAKK